MNSIWGLDHPPGFWTSVIVPDSSLADSRFELRRGTTLSVQLNRWTEETSNVDCSSMAGGVR